ncbi:uncharacterized protein ACRADG_012571 [Cochliomyia hominivorax]
MEISIKWNLCRVCLQEENKNSKTTNEQMRNIFEEDKTLVHYIYEFSGIFMKPNDSLPDKICPKCLNMIKNAVKFRKTCRKSNAYLLSILERTKNASAFFKPKIPEQDDIENNGFENEEEYEIETDANQTENSKTVPKQENKSSIKQIQNDEAQEERICKNNESLCEIEEIIEESTESSDETITITNGSFEEILPEMSYKKDSNNDDDDGDDDANSNNEETTKCKTSELEKYLLHESFTKSDNAEEHLEYVNDETDSPEIDNINKNDKELYYLLKERDHENLKKNSHEEHTENGEKCELYEIEEPHEETEDSIDDSLVEDLVMHLDEGEYDDKNNQAQVSSTVDNNDDIVSFHDDTSHESNRNSDLDKIYIVDENNSTQESQGKAKTAAITSRMKIKQKRQIQGREYLPLRVNVCEICGNQFTNRNVMNMHMKIHFQQKNHQCEICFKRFITACNLQAHMRIHTGEKPFECKYCGRRFNDRTSNLRHERTHTNEKPFKCASCGKTFTLATTLQNHIKVHTNERSYRCEPCGKSFKLPHHLKTHQNTTLHRSVLEIGTKYS